MFTRHGTIVFLCVFENNAEHRFELKKRDGHVHFDFVPNLKEDAHYGFRVEGPWEPESGFRFDATKLLLDPRAWALTEPFSYHDNLCQRGIDTAHLIPKCVAQKPLLDVKRPVYRQPEFIYELNVKAFTKLHPDIPHAKRGTVAALAEMPVINHLKKLGVDTIELMPVWAWIDERHLKPLGLKNAWGYNPVQFFAPDPKLAPGGLAEIRETISILHDHDFRVVLDVVLNHTGESDQFGPTLCFRGLDNSTYYSRINGQLINDTGCGNTVALYDPHVVETTVAALRHWVLKVGVDGFRFDLATVMGRLPGGFERDAPLLQALRKDSVLSKCVMIAEPWDIGPGGYQLGNFPEHWLEWNDRYRDDTRRFWRGDAYSANNLATRITGSSDIFQSKGKPCASVNFLSAHDGFTLKDIVAYDQKNNLNNGEDNRDGKSDEVTWLNGDVKALLATLFLSRGTIMLTAGDEFGRTQSGNNNAYAQDNEVTWLNWENKNQDLIDYVSKLHELRISLHQFFADEFLTGKPYHTDMYPDAQWFNEKGEAFEWGNGSSGYLGLALFRHNSRVALVFNSSNSSQPLNFLPLPNRAWQKIFCSKQGENCPSDSVVVYREINSANGKGEE